MLSVCLTCLLAITLVMPAHAAPKWAPVIPGQRYIGGEPDDSTPPSEANGDKSGSSSSGPATGDNSKIALILVWAGSMSTDNLIVKSQLRY